jgi:PleD family two-component response regulator
MGALGAARAGAVRARIVAFREQSWRRSWQRADLPIAVGLWSMKLIAIIEDEPAIRDNYAAAFTREGYAVRTYANRKQAMAACAARLPDLASHRYLARG